MPKPVMKSVNDNLAAVFFKIVFKLYNIKNENTIELHLSGLIGTAGHPDMQKIRIIGLFLENRLHWQFEVRLLLFTVCTCVETFRARLI